jgi:hypothetical protein
MIAGDGFRFGNLYGSYSANEEFNGIGFEIGFIEVPTLEEDARADTFSVAIKISHFIFAIGWIIEER